MKTLKICQRYKDSNPKTFGLEEDLKGKGVSK